MEKKRVILFVRVSSLTQDYTRQVRDLTTYVERRGLIVTKIIKEKISGIAKGRLAIQELLQCVDNKEADFIAISELSRLGRSNDVLNLIQYFNEKKVNLLIQDLNIETLGQDGKPNLVSDLLTSIINVMNKAERSLLIDRVVSGIRSAQANGVHCGRPKNSAETPEQFLKKHAKVVRDIKAGISIRKTAKLNGVSPVTVMKVIKILDSVVIKAIA